MRVYVDSSDLIDISSGRASIPIADFSGLLHLGAHKVVYSFDTLVEVSAPLLIGSDPLEVRRALNRLEKLPHIFINEARIRDLEMREAISAFTEGREYDGRLITPFAERIDQAIDVRGYPLFVTQMVGSARIPVPTQMIVNLGIWDAIYYVWRVEPEALNVHRRREQQWIQLVEADRFLEKRPGLPEHFITVLRRDLFTHGIAMPTDMEAFGRWVYKSPERCPGLRLAYEVHHRFLKNAGDRPLASDLVDLARMSAVPYVNVFITDKAMLDYCRQASRALDDRYRERFATLEEARASLASRSEPCARS